MEGTQTGVVLRTRTLELYVVTDDAQNIGLLLQGVCKVAGIRHAMYRSRMEGQDREIATMIPEREALPAYALQLLS